MAGGTFDKGAGKTLPGTYINFESILQDPLGRSQRGVVLIPLIDSSFATHSYGPEKEFIKIPNSAPDSAKEILGFSIYDTNPFMLLIREAFKKASEVIVYIPKQGGKAAATAGGITAKAKYGGKRGDDLSFSVVANPTGGFDVSVYLGADTVSQYTGLNTIEELITQKDKWIDFAGTGDLEEIAGVHLKGATEGLATNGDVTEFLDNSETLKWNAMAFPMEPSGADGDPIPALLEAVKSKIIYLRDSTGKYRKAVVTGLAADFEGITNVTNTVRLYDGTILTKAQATAWAAAADAGASNTQSLTEVEYEGAIDVIGKKDHASAVAAVNNGEFFFSFSDEGKVVVTYDINSLVTFKKPKDKSYRKNRVIRVLDTFGESIRLNFPPNKFSNSPTDWDVMEGLGRALLKMFEDDGAIKNVDYDNDFLIDRNTSEGDETYINVMIQPVDSSEKLYFTVQTR